MVIHRALAVAVVPLALSALGARQQGIVAPTGTAVLTGAVVTDAATSQPVRRATVRLAGAAGMTTRVVGTDDNGRFVFAALPAGSFTLSADKPGHVTVFHGAKRPGRGPGVPVAVADGARVDVTLRMLPGAAITGAITNELGQPVPGVPVQVIDRRPGQTGRAGQAMTDDRGMYRAFGLPPGDYVVCATPRLVPGGGRSAAGEVLSVSGAEVQWARGGGGARAMPPPGRSVAYAPIYFPGTPDLAGAAAVELKAGEERSGVSLAIRIVPVATIAGTLVDASGQTVSPATVTLYPRRRDQPTAADALVSSGAVVLPRAVVTASGFSIAGVSPGEYTIVARSGAGTRSAAPPDPNSPGPLWSVTDLFVDGNDQSSLVLRLLPGLKLSGKVSFESAALAPPQDLSAVEVSFAAAGANLGTASTPRAIVDRAGAFRFTGIPPGTFSLRAVAPAAPWVLKSAMLNGRDLADVPLDVPAGGEADGLMITFTDRAAEIAGRLVDAGGLAVTRYSIVVFSVDRAFWRAGARRVRLVQPATDGSFVAGGLPAGEYAIAAAEDVEAADLADPAFLAQLLPAALKVSLAEGEKKRQDLKTGR